MIQTSDRSQVSEDHRTLSEFFETQFPHDQKVAVWADLHICYSVVNLAKTALAYDDDNRGSVSFSASTALEMVSEKLMTCIATIDNLKSST